MYNFKMINKIVSEIIKTDKIAIFHHKNIDLDSIGCSYGLLLAIKEAFPEKTVVWLADRDDIYKRYSDINIDFSFASNEIDDSFLTIVGDASTKQKIAFSDEYTKGKTKICFDHHVNKEDINADILWKENLPASSIQAYKIINELLNKQLNSKIAFYLALGILSDTGSFSYSLNNTSALQTYLSLIEYLSEDEVSKIYSIIKAQSKEMIVNKKILLEKIQFLNTIAYAYISHEEWLQMNKIDAKNYVNVFENIKGYQCWVLVIEKNEKDFEYEITIRSNKINLLSFLHKHNGGGQLRAGVVFTRSIDKVKSILSELDEIQ